MPPTLHCIGRADAGSEEAEELAACFGPAAEVLWHDNGSAMPGRSWWELTRGFPERATGGVQWCTQFAGPFFYNSQ